MRTSVHPFSDVSLLRPEGELLDVLRKGVDSMGGIARYVKPGDTVLVGFSGGADSTALLQLLWNYGRQVPLQLEAVHVNHGIRGAEALRDQQFCEQFCQERNISFTVVQEDVPAQAARDGLSLEEAGRNARRRVFGHLAEKCQASVIALAHHQRDQAETMLFRLMRGTGLRGLCGMRPVNGNYIRPLLCVDRLCHLGP